MQLVLTVDTPKVPAIIAEMTAHRHWADPLLRERYDKAAEKSPQKLHASLALLPVDPGQVRLPLMADCLKPACRSCRWFATPWLSHKDAFLYKLWAVVEKPETGKESQRLRAAAALAAYDPDSKRWGANVQLEFGCFPVGSPRTKCSRYGVHTFRRRRFH